MKTFSYLAAGRPIVTVAAPGVDEQQRGLGAAGVGIGPGDAGRPGHDPASLGPQGVPNPLSDPTLTLYDAQGTELDFNDNWQDNPAAAEIEATTIPPNDPKEAAVLPTLAPGGYTAIVRGAGSATGTGLVEVYVLDPVP